MGRVNQAMQRARQSGLATEFDPITAGAYDASVMAAEPFPAESDQASVTLHPPEAVTAPHTDETDADIQEIFFNTYPEKVWGRQDEIDRLDNLLSKVKRRQ